jgi:hypothetical protein
MSPTERITPYIDQKLLRRNKIFLKESGNSIFEYNVKSYAYGKGETIARRNVWKNISLEKDGKQNNKINLSKLYNYPKNYMYKIYKIKNIKSGIILLESNSITEISIFLGYPDYFIKSMLNYYLNFNIILIKKSFELVNISMEYVPIISTNFFNKNLVITTNYKSYNKYYFECNPNTKIFKSKNNTHLWNDEINGVHYTNIDLKNIYPNKDGKYRKLSIYLYDPLFLIKVYTNLKNSNIIKEEIELNWFYKITELLKSGKYKPQKIRKSIINNKEIYIEDIKDRIISEGVRLLLSEIYEHKSKEYLSYNYSYNENKLWQTALRKIKYEWNDITWCISLNYDNIFLPIHRKIILSKIHSYIQDQGLLDILNKLFNSGHINLYYHKTFNRYNLPNKDLLSYLLINIFFDALDIEIFKIRKNMVNNVSNYGEGYIINNLRYIRYFNSFLLGYKGQKKDIIKIKDKLITFLKSNLHLNIEDKLLKIININSDKLIFLNTVITKNNTNPLLVKKKRNHIIQQEIKNKKIKKIKNNNHINKIQKIKNVKWIKTYVNMNKRVIKYILKNESKNKQNQVYKNENLINKINNYNNYFKLSEKNINNKSKIIKPILNKKKIKSNNLVNNEINNIYLTVDLINLKRILYKTGILNKKGKPIAYKKIINKNPYYIITLYNNLGNLLLNYFSYSDNYSKIKKLINYQIKWSLLHTLAAKHKNSIHQILNILYPDLKYKNGTNFIQFLTHDDIKYRKKHFLNQIEYGKENIEINWMNSELNINPLIYPNNEIKTNNYDKNKYSYRNYLFISNTNQKRLFSTYSKLLNYNNEENNNEDNF